MSKVNAIPNGMHTVTPHLVCAGAADAIEFYKKAFNATETSRLPGPNGRLMHASIRIGDSTVMLVDEMPEHGALGPQSLKGSPVTIHLYVDDVDAVAARGPGWRQDQNARHRHVLGRSLRPDRGSVWSSLVDCHTYSRCRAGRHAKSDAKHVQPAKSGAAGVSSLPRTVSRTRCSALAVHRRSGIVPNSGVCNGPGSAAHHFVLRCARDTPAMSRPIMTTRIMTWAAVAWIAVWLTPYLYAVNDLITWR